MSFESFIKSPIHRFRDMHKNPDMYPTDYVEKAEIERMLKEDELSAAKEESVKVKSEEPEKHHEVLGNMGKDIKNTVELLHRADILPAFADNVSEVEIIRQRREMALGLLERILGDIDSYLTQVNFSQLQLSADYDDLEKYQEAVSGSDTLRRSLHNKLISDIKMAMRVININFNADFPEEMRLREEAKMPERQGVDPKKLQELMRQRQYFNFPYPAGVFIDFQKAPKDPTGERLFIANWALKVYGDLTALTHNLKQKS